MRRVHSKLTLRIMTKRRRDVRKAVLQLHEACIQLSEPINTTEVQLETAKASVQTVKISTSEVGIQAEIMSTKSSFCERAHFWRCLATRDLKFKNDELDREICLKNIPNQDMLRLPRQINLKVQGSTVLFAVNYTSRFNFLHANTLMLHQWGDKIVLTDISEITAEETVKIFAQVFLQVPMTDKYSQTTVTQNIRFLIHENDTIANTMGMDFAIASFSQLVTKTDT